MAPFKIDPELVDLIDSFSNEDLISFAELHDGSRVDEHIELSIYADFAVYQRTHSSERYDRAVMRAEGWVAIAPNDLPDRKRRLEIFDALTASRDEPRSQASTTNGGLLNRIVNAVREAEGPNLLALLDQLIDEARGAVESTTPGSLDRISSLITYMFAFRFKYMATHRREDMDNLLGSLEQLVEACTENREKMVWLKMLDKWYETRFEDSQDTADLERVVETSQRLVQRTPADDPSRFPNLARVCLSSTQLFEETNSRADLDRAVEATSDALEAVPLDNPSRYGLLGLSGDLLRRRSDMNESPDDAERALEVLRPAMEGIAPDEPVRPKLLMVFSRCFFAHFERTDSI